MTDRLLEKFGRVLMAEVRDDAIDKYEAIVAGQMRSAPALELSKELLSLNHDQLSLVRKIVLSSIDDVVHNVLWMLEQHEGEIELNFSDGPNKANLSEISDGLCGEIYGEDGWIARYSKYKENY